MNTKCNVCDNKLENKIYNNTLLLCGKCSFITAALNLEDYDFEKIYGHDYFHGEEYASYVHERDVIQKNFNLRLNEIIKLTNKNKELNLYEIGCAYGFFLDLAKNFFSKVAGIDISEDAVNYAQSEIGVNADCGDFLNKNIEFTPDVICMWDVIEHMSNPDLVIKKASSILNNDGLLCITTGDIGSLNARIRGKKWRMIHPPTHLHYFNKNSISFLLEKHGFKTVSISYPPVIRTVRSILMGVLKIKWQLPEVYKFASQFPGQELAIPINLFDIMFVVARKHN